MSYGSGRRPRLFQGAGILVRSARGAAKRSHILHLAASGSLVTTPFIERPFATIEKYGSERPLAVSSILPVSADAWPNWKEQSRGSSTRARPARKPVRSTCERSIGPLDVPQWVHEIFAR
jgi:hypothetical protein